MQKHSTTKTTKRSPRKSTTKRPDGQDEFEKGLQEFAKAAYVEALDFYSEHHNNPTALNELQIRNPNPGDTHPEWIGLANAVAFIATSEAAPQSLKQPVIDFLSSESGAIWGDLMVKPPIIQRILVAAKSRQEDSDAAN